MAKKLPIVGFDNKVVPKLDTRSKDISSKGEVFENFNISLLTIDTAIISHLNQNLKPVLEQNGQMIDVETVYSNQELFNTIQMDGYYRDKNEKLLAPLIILSRNSVTKNREYMSKLDANFPQNSYYFEKKYSAKNPYNRMSSQVAPQKEFFKITVPDYVTVTYEGIILTNYVEHQNTLIETILYASDSYWGKSDSNEYRFLTKVESGFSDNSDVSVDNERIIKSSFQLVVNGYIIPNIPYANMNNTKEHNYTHSKQSVTIKN
jgi:hypothetical protein